MQPRTVRNTLQPGAHRPSRGVSVRVDLDEDGLRRSCTVVSVVKHPDAGLRRDQPRSGRERREDALGEEAGRREPPDTAFTSRSTRASPTPPPGTRNSPGLVQNCPAPSVIDAAIPSPISGPRAAAAAGVTIAD